MICKKCGQSIADDAEFCGFCGGKVNKETPLFEDDNKKICPQCGSFIENESLFCGECGYNFSSVQNETASTEPSLVENSDTTSKKNMLKKETHQKNSTVLIYVLLSVIAILLCCCIYILLNNNSSDENINTSEKNNPSIYTAINNPDNYDSSNDEGIENEFASGLETNKSNDDKDYLLPTDTRRITIADLEEFSTEEIALIRNEIYARHGYVFQTEPFKSYFGEKDWYIPNPDFTEAEFSEIELANKNLIVEYETEMGWR